MKNTCMEVKKIIRRDVPLSYSNFSEIRISHTDAHKMQLRRLINGKHEFH